MRKQKVIENHSDCGKTATQLIVSLLKNSAKKQEHSTPIRERRVDATKQAETSNQGQQSLIRPQPTQRAAKPITASLSPKSNDTLKTKLAAEQVSTLTQSPASGKNCHEEANNSVELRNLETWHDEDEDRLDESHYQELVDLGNTNGWSADEMFEYNEKRHKVTSSYTEKTLGDKYTTPLPKIKSKTTVRMAIKLAKEIEEKLQADGRVTPESSDDDEMFELERTRRNQLKQQKQLEQLKVLKAVNSLSIHSQNGRNPDGCSPRIDLNRSSNSSEGSSTSTANGHRNKINNRKSAPINNQSNVGNMKRAGNKSSSQQSNSSTTPVTASLSSSPTLNDSINHHHLHHITKPVTSSSRNILRTCLT